VETAARTYQQPMPPQYQQYQPYQQQAPQPQWQFRR
jgi:hypothetical protein